MLYYKKVYQKNSSLQRMQIVRRIYGITIYFWKFHLRKVGVYV